MPKTMTCQACKEPVLFEHCGCGGSYERALSVVTNAVRGGAASAVLEHAARRWIDSAKEHGGAGLDEDLDALYEALEKWLAERSR